MEFFWRKVFIISLKFSDNEITFLMDISSLGFLVSYVYTDNFRTDVCLWEEGCKLQERRDVVGFVDSLHASHKAGIL